LLTQNVCFGVMNLDEHETCMIGLFSNLQKLKKIAKIK
jgi:hypothetical protein